MIKDKYIQKLEELNFYLSEFLRINHHRERDEEIIIRLSLESELSSLKAQMEKEDNGWINVNDKLPDDSCAVFIATNHGKVGEMWYSKDYKWHTLRDNATVTHWMPLPKLPIKSKT